MRHRNSTIAARVAVSALALIACGAHPADGQEAAPSSEFVEHVEADVYLLAVFSSQSIPKDPSRTHTWGVAVHVRPAAAGAEVVAVDTISWMPESMRIDLLRLRVVPGWNLTNEQTFDFAVGARQRISLWGVMQLPPEAYADFVRQKALLESKTLGYQCLDTIGEAAALHNGTNCIHALADFADLLPHLPVAMQPYGDESAAQIVLALRRRGLTDVDECRRDWLVDALQLNRWPIRRRNTAMPTPAVPAPY